MNTTVRILACCFAANLLACKTSTASTSPDPDQNTGGYAKGVDEPPLATEVASVDDAWGGRLFDRWYRELKLEFSPGKSGGPRGDGTLQGPDGSPRDPDGHSYRLKNFFGWDLRGASGIYGPDYQNKSYVVKRDLLAKPQSVDELMAWLRDGDADIPAYGEVMSDDALRATATFIAKMQNGELPRADAIWSLSKDAPKNYALNEGADLALGKQAYADACASCHGDDGTEINIDDMSLGTFARTKGYEAWIKVLNGHPGTQMHREIEFDSAEQAASMTLGILAALCDRTQYPVREGQDAVADGDLRCGAYLK